MATALHSILVVDDEPALLRLMQAWLERLSYRVAGAATAKDALEIYRREPGGFSLVLTDLSLPDMPGNEMAAQILNADDKVRVLLCSGYPFELACMPPDVRHRVDVLQKPFVPAMLARAVEDLLSR